MFIVTLYVKAELETIQIPSPCKWMKYLGYIHTMKYWPAIKMSQLLIYTKT